MISRWLIPFSLAILTLQGCGGEPRWNVLVVTLDTTRADVLGCYGKESARTPNLDRLAAEGVLFEHAVSSNPVTLPSHSTIMTGTYPLVHGVRDNGLFSLPAERTTLAEILAAEGYATAAAVGSFPLDRQFGLAQGFGVYDDHVTITSEDYEGRRIAPKSGVYFDERPAARVNDAILPWLREHAARPFFAWIHYWDAHYPHTPPAPFDQIFHQDLYQGEVAYVDQSLGVILRELEDRGVYDRTLIVVVADHGEGLGEHREETHSLLAYDSTLRVPLILRVPGEAGGRRIARRVGTVDILPTVLDFLGITAPAEVQGTSQVPLIRGHGSESPNRTPIYAETLTPRLSHGWGELRVLYGGSYKYIHGPRPELFDLGEDPQELRDLSDERPAESERLRTALESFLTRNAGGDAGAAVQEVDAETRRRLAALGYLSTGGDAPGTVREELRSDGVPPQDRAVFNTLESRLRTEIADENYLVAKDLAARLIEIDPGKAFYQAMLARALLGLGQLEAAARIGEDPGSEAAARHPRDFLPVANQLFAGDQKRRALALAERVAAGGESADAYYLLAELHGDLGDLDTRLRALEQALELEPGHPQARLSLAIYFAQVGSFEMAKTELLELLEEHPLFARAHFNYAVILLQFKRWQEAVTHLERCVRIEPEYWQAYLAQLTAYLALGERDQAEAVLQRLEDCPDPQVLQNAHRLLYGA